MLTPLRTTLILVSAALAAAGLGCGNNSATSPTSSGSGGSPTSTAKDPAKLPDDAELLRQLHDALDFTLEKRRLDVKDQAARQIIHRGPAYKRKFLGQADGQNAS